MAQVRGERGEEERSGGDASGEEGEELAVARGRCRRRGKKRRR